jgi:hypothetical protein
MTRAASKRPTAVQPIALNVPRATPDRCHSPRERGAGRNGADGGRDQEIE